MNIITNERELVLYIGRLDDYLNNLDVQEKPGRPCCHVFKNLDVQLLKRTKNWRFNFFVQGLQYFNTFVVFGSHSLAVTPPRAFTMSYGIEILRG